MAPGADAETIFEERGHRYVRVNASARIARPDSSAPCWDRPSTFWNEEVYELRGSELIESKPPPTRACQFTATGC